jgi:hypothetical protein
MQSSPRRAAALLRAAWPDASEDDVLKWSIGLRDARLLTLRRWLFGPDLAVVASCPSCGEPVESNFRVDEVLLAPEGQSLASRGGTHVIERQGYTVTFHAPRSSDLLALTEAPIGSKLTAREQLLAHCVIDVRGDNGAPSDLAHLPAEVIADIGASMSAADPQADVQLACVCPSCGGAWDAIFDIATVLWTEIHAWARHLLRDVHVLARAYGWREADVLALSPSRRRMYLELVAP